ncbi:flagella synthesis protein FlgN [Paraburkholderia sp. 22099]|jgi:flagellar biosynthesis protein FlgN|uniref:flagella synthesis protein FlgN n=1 Tax=Paraburkholderia TaxID=1822464 RepID=UPI0009F42F3B|nr:flagellar protein FlgN [Paraburkholderia terricola]AXE93911.1 flagellar protein FlgN [Paraburkholderia terricola]MDR6448205.1 flagella synthesis protein FlgN [Paraburkholderia terricola]MDR6492964.1 flagella synthesis protein FlgN [Paraburkholderia terricola]ORC46070.1 flagellar biosynthesis protein FlgN [Burkholderia sp. A27]
MKDALLATLTEEYSAVEAFASILTLETRALTALSPLELLPPIVEKKTELIGVLAKLETTRDALLAEMGFPAGWSGMELAASTDARIAGQWSLLQKAADRARRSNASNGELIRVRMDYNQRALTALQVAMPQKAGFYGPDGRIPARAAV